MGGVARIIKSTPQIFKKVTPPPAVVAPTKAEVSQATSTNMYRPEDMPNDMSGVKPEDRPNDMSGRKPEDMSNAEISIANRKKGRSKTILNTSGGLGSSSLNTTKKTLGA